MHKAKHQLHIRHANRLHVFNNIVGAIDPLLTKPVLTIIHIHGTYYYVQEYKN